MRPYRRSPGDDGRDPADATDDVVVCCRSIEAGETIATDHQEFMVTVRVPLGHKLVLILLKVGDKVVKYGMPIGSMTVDAAPGEWIHMHNMKSDYLAAHLRDATGDQA